MDAMERDLTNILTFEVPDDALESAAVITEVRVTTIGVCTY